MVRKIINIINKLQNNYLDYLKFIIQLLFWVLILFLLLPTLVRLFNSFFHTDILLADFILLITAAFIIAYTYETKKMQEQIKRQVDFQTKPNYIDIEKIESVYNNECLETHIFLFNPSVVAVFVWTELTLIMEGKKFSGEKIFGSRFAGKYPWLIKPSMGFANGSGFRFLDDIIDKDVNRIGDGKIDAFVDIYLSSQNDPNSRFKIRPRKHYKLRYNRELQKCEWVDQFEI